MIQNAVQGLLNKSNELKTKGKEEINVTQYYEN